MWSQLNDWTADGRPDENAYNNCGPESVAACLRYLTGIELPADYIKDVMYGEKHLGYTDVPHLVQFLQAKCLVPCETYSGNAATLLQPVVRRAINAGNPIIVLYFWTLSNPASGHFCPVVSYDELGCARANVWNGQMEYWNWNKFEQWQKLGIAIVLKRVRASDLQPRRAGGGNGVEQNVATEAGVKGEALPAPQDDVAQGGATRGLELDPLVGRMRAMLAEARFHQREAATRHQMLAG
jgi:hypothetical protein